MNKLDYKKLNDLIKLGNKILKILYILVLILGIWLISMTWELWNVSKFLILILKLLSPLLIGFLIAYFFNPIVTKFEKKGLNRMLVATILYLILSIIIFLFFKYFSPVFINQLGDIVKNFPNIGNLLKDIINKVFDIFKNTGINTHDIKIDIFKKISTYFINSNLDIFNNFMLFITRIFSGIGIVIIGMIIGFYLLIDYKNTIILVKNFIPRKQRDNISLLAERIGSSLVSYINGTFIIFMIVLVVSIIAFYCIKLDGAVVLSLFYSIASTIPYLGSYIGGIPIIIIGFSHSFQAGILTFVAVVTIQVLLTYVINPVIMNKKEKIHPVGLILGLIILGYFFGIVGILIAAPFILIIKLLINYFDENYEIKNYNIESKDKK